MGDYQKFHQYDYLSRWVSYWHQIDEVLKMDPKNVLEIGIGNKTVTDYLKKQGVAVTTLDINPKLKPDIVGSVLKIPVADGFFDVILCAEVLEHLSFDDFENCLKELKRVACRGVVLSLPHFGPTLTLSFKIPFIRQIKIAWKVPYHPKHQSKYQFNGGHQWEIGKKKYTLSKVRNIIKKHFQIERNFIPWENQYHHFFILEKRN